VASDEDLLFIDVAGGKGHDTYEFDLARKKLKLAGKLILQDLGHVLAQIPEEWTGHFISMPHDIFRAQPAAPQASASSDSISIPTCVGARCYFLRTVLHDWPDSDCVKILQHISNSMSVGYSTLLINEYVLLDQGCRQINGKDFTRFETLADPFAHRFQVAFGVRHSISR
jgi:hypothetical protein